MANQEFYSRIIHKHDTEANWNKAATNSNFIPIQGEIIVYDKDDNYDYERIKIGDGTTKVNTLPFIDTTMDSRVTTLESDVKNASKLTTGTLPAERLPAATSSALGGVKIGSNISNSSGTISLTKANVTAALGYTPPTSDTNTTYTFATGDSNGQIKITPSGGSAQNVSVKGLGSAAYTASTAYATAAQGTKADNAVPTSRTINNKALTSNITLSASDVGAVPTTGGTLYGQFDISRTAADKASPIEQDFVINYALPSGTALTEKNAPGIGFHVAGSTWGSLIFDNKFKFINADSSGYLPVQASEFIGNLNGNATSATKATQDAGGNNIANTYATKTELNAIDWFDNGTSIPSNADLNNYTTQGMYYSANETTSTSLTNCPTTGNFKMYVFQRTGSSVIDQLILGRSSMYLRGTNSSGTWSSWTTFASQANVMPIAGGTFTGNAKAYSTNRSGDSLRNITVQNNSSAEVSTNRIIMKRK